MFGFLKKKNLEDQLGLLYTRKIHGVFFRIRKLNPIDHVTGAKVLQQHFDIWKTKTEKAAMLEMVAGKLDKVQAHCIDVFMAAVVDPKLSRSPDARQENEHGAIYVGNLFSDWDLVSELYTAIMEVTYGKKKLKSLTSPESD